MPYANAVLAHAYRGLCCSRYAMHVSTATTLALYNNGVGLAGSPRQHQRRRMTLRAVTRYRWALCPTPCSFHPSRRIVSLLSAFRAWTCSMKTRKQRWCMQRPQPSPAIALTLLHCVACSFRLAASFVTHIRIPSSCVPRVDGACSEEERLVVAVEATLDAMLHAFVTKQPAWISNLQRVRPHSTAPPWLRGWSCRCRA